MIIYFLFHISHFSFLIDMSFNEKCEMTNEKSLKDIHTPSIPRPHTESGQ